MAQEIMLSLGPFATNSKAKWLKDKNKVKPRSVNEVACETRQTRLLNGVHLLGCKSLNDTRSTT